MANLLPENIKKEIRQSFFYRKLTVVAFVILILVIIGCVLMTAIYFYLILGGGPKEEKGKLLEELSITDQSLIKEADELGKKLELLKPEKAESLPSQVFGELVASRKGGIRLHHLVLECPSVVAGCVVAVIGRADDRQNLLDYVQALKENPMFTKVQSPINNLINGKDSQFTLELETVLGGGESTIVN